MIESDLTEGQLEAAAQYLQPYVLSSPHAITPWKDLPENQRSVAKGVVKNVARIIRQVK